MGVVHLQMIEGCAVATLAQGHRVLPVRTNPMPLLSTAAPCWTLTQAQLGSASMMCVTQKRAPGILQG